MALNLKITHKLFMVALMTILFVAGVGIIGQRAVHQIDMAGDSIVVNQSALRAELEADMAHDAIRADVYAALYAGATQDAASEAAIKKDLAEHGAIIHERLAQLGGKDIAEQVRAKVEVVRPKLDRFLNEAESIVTAAFKNGDQARLDLPVFVASFDELEGDMANVSDEVQGFSLAVQRDYDQTAESSQRAIKVATIAGALVALVVGFFFARAITRPLARAVSLAQRVAEGDLTAVIEVTSKDEIGQLMSALKAMNENLNVKIGQVVAEVRTNSASVLTSATELLAGNTELSSRTEQQASTLEETSASVEEISASVKQNAEAAAQARELTEQASANAAINGEAMEKVVQTMERISGGSKKISEITGVIDGIAFQTNILALNAAVEAARAGDHGRGFSVVATEVRALAQRAAVAAKEIKTLITETSEQVESGGKDVADAGETSGKTMGGIREVAQFMNQIAAASREQSNAIEQINQAVMQMDEVTQRNAAMVEEATAAAGMLEERAQDLVRVVSLFRLGADTSQADGVVNAAAAPTSRQAKPIPRIVREPVGRFAKQEISDDWNEF